MQSFSYPCTIIEVRPGDFEARFADVPEALTFGDTLDQALENAWDALACAIDGRLRSDEAIPTPRASGAGELAVALDPAVAARAALRAAMKQAGVNNSALGKRMGRDEKAVRRILSGNKASLSMTLEALRAMGLKPALSV
jgi:antitoxin HicB